VEKISFMPRLFSPNDLTAMKNLREAFNPTNRLSPDKMLPTAAGCGVEQWHPGRRAAL
jgi:glycolate oxidase